MTSYLHLAPTSTADEEVSLVPLPIRVFLAEDHPLMRRSLRLLIEHEPDLQLLGEAASLEAAEHAVERLHPQVLVLDLSMHDGSSVELIGLLRSRVTQTQIVVLTNEHDPAFARRALAAGAIGFAVKELADAELPQAVRAAARGEQYVSPRVADRLQPREPRLRRLRSADGRTGAS